MSRTPHVSDHALLRWLERYMEIDMDAVRATILTAERQDAIHAGASAIHCRAEGVVLIVAPCGTITTVLERRMRGRQDFGAEVAP